MSIAVWLLSVSEIVEKEGRERERERERVEEGHGDNIMWVAETSKKE